MKRLILLMFIAVLLPALAEAATMGQKLAGQILLNVEKSGEAWYVYPENNKRYYLGRPDDAFAIMRELGLGINEADFQRLAQAGMPVAGDQKLAERLSGRIVLQVEKNGEAWYIYPQDLKKYYLGRPADAFRIMRELSLGITREDLAKVHKPGAEESIDQYSKYEHKTISTKSGDYEIDLITIDLAMPFLKITTAMAEPCPEPSRDKNKGPFAAGTLGGFALENNGFAGINGTYFCAGSGCGAANYYFYPLYDSASGRLVNEDQLKYWTTGPILAFDQNNKFYYFKDSREFPVQGWSPPKDGQAGSGGKSVAEAFYEEYGVGLQAAIGNKPRLIEDRMNLLIDWDIDEKQKSVKSLRNALGYKDNKVYLVVARDATVPDLADVMEAMEIEYAVNLDGGYSSALWYNDEYMVGPGRNVPNAIIFSVK